MTTPVALGASLSGRRVLVTGHTGFKGSWLSLWLLRAGARVTGYALEPDTTPSLFEMLGLASELDSRIGDIRDGAQLATVVREARPEVVFHLAAQPLVRRSYLEPLYTIETNVLGTANLLEALRGCSETRAVVNVTTDKVYENPERGTPFSEDDPLGGHDPYAASKACAEIVTASYRDSFLTRAGGALVATARAGNVIGGGDWATDRIVPDVVRALGAGRPVLVRNPDAIRPWQHVIEPLAGYLTLAERLLSDERAVQGAYNFGPDPAERHTVREVVEAAIGAWGSGTWEAEGAAERPHEAATLVLAIDRAAEVLGWRPVWGFEQTVERTVGWYRAVLGDHAEARSCCEADIEAYEQGR